MSFTPEDMKRLAGLSRLGLSTQECERFSKDLSQIVHYVACLQEVDVSDVDPMVHAVPIELRLREDILQPTLGRKAIEGSQGYEDGLVKVPKIIE